MNIPKGYKLVPVALTDEMREAAAGADAWALSEGQDQWRGDAPIWGALLAAAPASPQAAQPEHYKATVPKFKFDTLVEHCKLLERDLAESRAHVNEITLYQENAVWFWQHDGQDFLESLSCPIIIQPHHLRELITHADAGEVEQFPHGSEVHKAVFMALESYSGGDTFEQGVIALAQQSREFTKERDTLRAQLAEAIGIIGKWKATFGEAMARRASLYVETDAFLSTTAKPEADHE